MFVENFKAKVNKKVSELVCEKYSVSYNEFMKILRNKDIKINGRRISSDEVASAGDEITFYHKNDFADKKIDIVFEDENVIVVFKPRKIEVQTENLDSENDLKTKLKEQIKSDVYAVHRLDKNTTGLVIFAKNEMAKNSLDRALKERTLEKHYLTLVVGQSKERENLTAFLKKDAEKSLVYISDFPQKGYEKIETRYKKLEFNGNLSLLDVELVTGKTHQIRAHLSHIGLPILGDEKYGCSEINKNYKLKYQCLCAYKIKFNFGGEDYLSYLNGKIIELDKTKIDFLKLL